MTDLGRILLADDEETFLLSTADLLRKAGFTCDTARDGHEAIQKLSEEEYDLLIADIKMPGNMDLDLVRNLPAMADGMPVILATGYPSMTSAIQAVQLPVAAYVLKPCDFDELLDKVKACLDQAQTSRAIQSTHERLVDWQQELTRIDSWMKNAAHQPSQLSTNAYLSLTIENIIGSLLDIRYLVEAMAIRGGHEDALLLLTTRPEQRLKRAVAETVTLLKRRDAHTPDADLADLRVRLESMMGRLEHE